MIFFNYLRDSHTIPFNCPKPSPWELVWRTFRFRLAAVGLYLSQNERRFANYKDRHRGQRSFILGNGPSLNDCDLSLLKDEITFGVNSIFLNEKKMGFYPTYYVIEDVFVAEDRADEINRYNGPKKFFGSYLKYCIRDNPSIIWLNVKFRYDDYLGFPNFSENALRMVWTGGTVTYLCLQLSYYMGFSEVFLVGCDHNYVIPPDAKTSGTEILSTSDDPNHFDPQYFGHGYRWHDPMVDRMEKAYLKADKIFRADNRKIVNATKGGRLEVFERTRYEDLFK
jgi:6-hydroxymethylpterin diphosphokinase MptE-like